MIKIIASKIKKINMKKIILMATALMIGTVVGTAQTSDSTQFNNTYKTGQISHQKNHEDEDRAKENEKYKSKGYEKAKKNEKPKKNDHWMAAKKQLESAKRHLQIAAYDPGNQRETAIKHIDAALKQIELAFSGTEPAISNPPTKNPPVALPPVKNPPVVQPPVVQPPVPVKPGKNE